MGVGAPSLGAVATRAAGTRRMPRAARDNIPREPGLRVHGRRRSLSGPPSHRRGRYTRTRFRSQTGNYRALRDVELRDITPLTVLLAPNGSGKSTFLDVFSF